MFNAKIPRRTNDMAQRSLKMRGVCLLLLLLVATTSSAKVILPRVIDSHMVLQQNTNVRLWGWSDKKEVTIVVSWNSQVYHAKVVDSRWFLMLPTPYGSYSPQTIIISDSDGEIELSDLLIGEVWICSGQSNMEMPMRGNLAQPVKGSLTEIMHSGEMAQRIRFITIPKDESGVLRETFDHEQWQKPSSETTLMCSAAAWYFAKHLTRSLDVPVGLIINAWGGSRIEAWMDEESLSRVEGLDIKAAKSPTLRVRERVTMLYNTMHAPICGFTAKGFLWYQGESNVFNYHLYPALMREMVSLWRHDWQQPDMPFIFVQIAPYNYGNSQDLNAAFLREAQMKARRMIHNSWIIPTTDIGDELCIHPEQKDIIGLRLASTALNHVYGMENIPAEGPMMKEVNYADGKAFVEFEGAPMALYPNMMPLAGFEVAGEDHVFYPAQAQTQKRSNIVEVFADEVSSPIAVRYAFHNYTPNLSLADTYGNAAFPFRTDDWE